MQKKEVDIVLIEDNPDDVRLTIRELKKNKFVNNIIHLKDGEDAINYFFGTSKNKLPKLVLLDLKLPKISGINILTELKKNEQTKFIPVVIFTSSNLKKDIIEAYKTGANSYLVKPVDFKKLSEILKQTAFYWLIINENRFNLTI